MSDVEALAEPADGSALTGEPTVSVTQEPIFDFEEHRKRALESYQAVVESYKDFARILKDILETCLARSGTQIHSIEARAKDPDSFAKKASKVHKENRNKPKYKWPLSEITDLAAARVITFFLSDLSAVGDVIEHEFDVREKSNKAQLLDDEGRLGYQSIHYVVALRPNRFALPEYEKFRGLLGEIQVRTILQHAWAEIEHDMQYKTETASSLIKRRFLSLAGMLEIADREFQAIQEEDVRLKAEARQSVAEGRLEDVEITADALKTYLDAKFGADGRMADWSYRYTARLLQDIGFSDLNQVDRAISGIDDDLVSRKIWGSRQGQLSRFEDALMVALGEEWTRRHPWSRTNSDFRQRKLRVLEELQAAGIPVGTYRPAEGD